MRDLMNNLAFKRALSPVASAGDNTAWTTEILDTRGYDSVMLAILTGALPDADATFTVVLNESVNSNMSSSNAVADADLNGTEALAGFIFSDDNKVFKLGYTGTKRYLQAVITPANNTGASLYAAVWVLGKANRSPTVNPPA